ncbi:MAG TPA: hypothetical protein VEQ11_20935 [Chloroflexota bacterium]|nr:hypothetical protein [Chloroflexota bacterium]
MTRGSVNLMAGLQAQAPAEQIIREAGDEREALEYVKKPALEKG